MRDDTWTRSVLVRGYGCDSFASEIRARRVGHKLSSHRPPPSLHTGGLYTVCRWGLFFCLVGPAVHGRKSHTHTVVSILLVGHASSGDPAGCRRLQAGRAAAPSGPTTARRLVRSATVVTAHDVLRPPSSPRASSSLRHGCAPPERPSFARARSLLARCPPTCSPLHATQTDQPRDSLARGRRVVDGGGAAREAFSRHAAWKAG